MFKTAVSLRRANAVSDEAIFAMKDCFVVPSGLLAMTLFSPKLFLIASHATNPATLKSPKNLTADLTFCGLEAIVEMDMTNRQRENTAKFFLDLSKISFTILIVANFADLKSFDILKFSVGLVFSISTFLIGYRLDT